MRTGTKIALATVATAFAGAIAFAATGEAHGWGPGGRGGHAMMMGPALGLFDEADADRNGTVTKAELDAFGGDRLKRFDADGNGELSLDEFQGLWVELTRPVRVRAFQFVDADGNGQITTAEMQKPLDMALQRMDRNDDGSIARDELARGHHRGRDRGDRGGDRDD